MAASALKSILPRSLFGRSLLILMVPIIVLQLVVGLVFFQRHYMRVTVQLTEGVAMELRYAVGRIESAGTSQKAADLLPLLSGPLELGLSLQPGSAVERGTRKSVFDATGGRIVSTLRTSIARDVSVDLLENQGRALISVPTGMGTLTADVARSRLAVSNPHQLLVLMLAAAILLSTIAVLFLRNQVRPIRRLAEAAEAFGKGRAMPFRPEGAEEVRRAGNAFVAMRSRLERQIDQRTQMLSGVSHDLRTPLTRMKLSLAMMEESDEIRDLGHDIDQMERMLGEFLAFARGDALEQTEAVNPFRLAADVSDAGRRSGAAIEQIDDNGTPDDPLVHVRAGALQRALQNLVTNATRYGTSVRLTVSLRPRRLDYIIEDDGPGISEADRERAIQPFERLDGARSLNDAGNVGLGMSIASGVARSHGGVLELDGSPDLGGLRAVLRIPR